MKTILAAGVLAFASFGLATPAFAATQTVNLSGSNGTLSGTFERANVPGGSFTDVFNFTLPDMGTVSAALITISTSAANNINFNSAFLTSPSGTRTPLVLTGPGTFETGTVSTSTQAGAQSLTVNGFSGGNGSYSGVISFQAMAGAVPEPGTWAFLLLGFGAIGAGMRRRRSAVRTTVSYA